MRSETLLDRRRWLFAGIALQVPKAASAAAPPATAADLVLANVWDPRRDPARCLVSEKYDGVRALWDGTGLRHRSGRPLAAPAWFTAGLPAEPLDGELWMGRRRFDRLSAVVRRHTPDDAGWRSVRYLVFELPNGAGTFAERAARIATLVAATRLAHVEAVAQRRVADPGALQRLLDATVAAGGEGLMLHDAAAPYVRGRSDALSKLKPYLDAEAVVVGHRGGRGRLAGEVGALVVRAPDGRTFRVGSGLGDALRRDPPPLGSVVTYRYRDLTPGGLPRFATLLRRAEAM
ncbi:DNA ligase [Piscinibacter koreensis]|uniref:DNA ligase n=1 Tax=Piscinibacter koreensis TaxID=2742824 RepID=A0A7Y6NJY5_9BURK|nr:DNA ligase [Schlegelella koreensis]NUZ04573.1 DNA ligase [Schlegelella koreensis]